MNDSISESLGLTDEWFENRLSVVTEGFDVNNEVHELMINQIKEVRFDELGEVDAPISNYEKKLILCGYLVGIERIRISAIPDLLNDLKDIE